MVYSDIELRLKEGFASLVEPHQTALLASAIQFTRNRADAEDLLQETLMRAFIGYKRSQAIEKPRAWLFRIMRNAYINRYHKNRVEASKVSYDEGVDHKIREIAAHGTNDPQEAFFGRFLDAEIEEALDSLPEYFRESVILCDITGLSYQEIGDILSCPLGTVRSRIARGRELLYNKLYDYAVERNLIPEAARM